VLTCKDLASVGMSMRDHLYARQSDKGWHWVYSTY